MSIGVTWPILTAQSGIDHYFKDIQRFPMLDPQEEYLLANRWREEGDRDAAHKLVTSHLRLVAKIAKSYRGFALDKGDMRPDQVKLIAKRLGVTEQDVIDMNRRLGGDAAIPASGRTGWWTNPRTRKRRSPRATSSITAARCCPMRSVDSTSASGASSRAGAWPKT